MNPTKLEFPPPPIIRYSILLLSNHSSNSNVTSARVI